MKNYYKRIDIIRIVSCLAILFYHIGVLKGGYLAVCTFFVMTGYLSTISAFKKEKFSIKDYYLSRLKKIYLPAILIVFISIVVISTISNFNWINLRPEVRSILLGYNNYWQLNANLDYFTRYISSPFMHLWYLSILIQFEIIFPFIFILFRKIGKKLNKLIPCIILFILVILSYLLFLHNINNGNIMVAYYDTLSRVFSILFGILVGFIHIYYRPLVIKNKQLSIIIFLFYLTVLIIMFIFIDSNSSIFNISMLIATIISMRLIDYSINKDTYKNVLDLLIASLSKISYEIYLIQYPVIFLFQDIEMNNILKIILIVIITIFISIIIHFFTTFKKKKNKNLIKIIGLIPIIILAIFGAYKYMTSKDYTNDKKKLEEDLNNNRELIEQKQKEYLESSKKEQEEWEEFLNSEGQDEEKIQEYVRNMKIVGIGDSVMELAVKNLYKEFPNGYFDGLTNRTEKAAIAVLRDLKEKDLLGDAILFNLGINGSGFTNNAREEMLEIIGDRKIFWVNATNPDYSSFNPGLIDFANKHDNVYIVDWVSVATAHPEYLIYDKVHPTVYGCGVYAKTIYDEIYKVYLNEYKEKRNQKIKEHDEQEKNKITFIGNDLLIGIYQDINEAYNNKKIIVDSDFSYDSLIKRLKNEELSNNIVFVFDNSLYLSKEDYQKIKEILKDKNIYIINTSNISNIDNIKLIDFDIKDYILFDNVHISEDGNKKLLEIIKNNIK